MDQTQSRRGRPPRITHDQIAQAVIDVGFPNLTFAAVREKLGVGESTLYRYAPDRDEGGGSPHSAINHADTAAGEAGVYTQNALFLEHQFGL